MSSSDTAKKRKIEGNNVEEGEDIVSMSADGTTLSVILAEMKDMKCKLTRMDELESKSALMQNEINSMKDRVSHIDELERKNKLLEDECSLLKRSVKSLIKESNWEYSAPTIPRSHWEDSTHYDEDVIDGIEYLLCKIEDITCALRSCDDYDYDIQLDGYGIEDENNGPTVPHDNLLLPHWRELANAMQIFPDDLYEFRINGIQLSSSVLKLLEPALNLKGKINYTLALTNNEFTNVREGIEFAVKVIKANHNLQEFRWMHNQITNMEDAKYLTRAIINHPSIDNVCLDNCFGGDINGYDILCTLLASGKAFVNIGFESNNIKTNGGTAISDYIARNPPPMDLNLSNNKLNDKDALLIANALKQNTNLSEISLDDNEFTDVGKEILYKAIYDPTSLNTLAVCNHTCRLYGDTSGGRTGLDDFNTHRDEAKTTRVEKIYYLLSNRNKEGSNVQHLNEEFDEEDDSLKLSPKVLERISRLERPSHRSLHHRFVQPLSIMYEVIRSWEMPELFEAASGQAD